jgi:nucleoside-diphosphate-sugar epimerase
VLVTGSAGRVGRPLVRELLVAGYDVTAAVDGRADTMGQLPAELDGARVSTGDACDQTAVARAVEGVDAVVHLAAIPHPSRGTAFEVFTNNVTATFAALTAAGEAGVSRVVIASSINATGIPFNRHRPTPAYFPLDSEMPVDHDDAYSLAKYCDEASLRMACRHWGMTGFALRLPLMTTDETIGETMASAARDPGAGVREGWSYLDVRDGARAFRLAVEARVEGAHVVMVASGTTLLDEPTELLLARHAPGVPVRRPIPGRSVPIDLEPARRLLGFSAGA